jgi:exopolyphosphatase/guanosine-5'-triphosphate,3'-diphosphate pyrophosphatase
MRVATIDIGTNTVLLLVAERNGGGPVRAVLERAEITRLGEGVDRTRALSPAAVERTRVCLARYARDVRESAVDAVAVVGTSAMRDADGGAPLAAFVREAFGVDVRVLAGDDEARMTFRGALLGMPQAPGGAAAVFDIGGGSTEVILGRLDGGRLIASYLHSFDVGSVRLTERHFRHDPPLPGEILAMREALDRTFGEVPLLAPDVRPVGVAGTMTTLASVSLGLSTYERDRVHGLSLGAKELGELVDRLAAQTVDERKRVPGMEPKRADVLVAGGCIAVALLQRWGGASALVSDGGVRWGLAQELLGTH